MGKRIITQARGKGSSTYRVKKKAFRYKLAIPARLEGEGVILKLVNSQAHTCPLAKVKYSKGTFYMPACKGMFEGQKMDFDSKEIKDGNILQLKNIPLKTNVNCIESRPNDGGKFIKSGGNSATVSKNVGSKVAIMFPSKKEKVLNEDCRAIIGVIAGDGRTAKPILKAGKQFHIKKSKSKLWPRTSAVKMNAIDHPFGSGRAKNPKSKVAKRNSPPGKKVGLIRPKRTGKKK